MPIDARLVKWDATPSAPTIDPRMVKWDDAPSVIDSTLKNLSLGNLKGASSIGATLLSPIDKALDYISPNGNGQPTHNDARRASLQEFFNENADPNSAAFKTGDLGAGIAGTAGVGGVLAKGASAIPALTKYAPLLESGGFNLNGSATNSTLANTALRAAGGAIPGYIQAGMINPDQATTGAVLGGAIPAGGALLGKATQAIGRGIAGNVSPEVNALYQKAQQYGVDVPLDRLTNSKPLNALASSLNYVPLSGRSSVEANMESGLNKALSNTFGEDTPNVSMALRAAPQKLGSQFDAFLKGNNVNLDANAVQSMQDTLAKARNELNDQDYKIIENQYHNIIDKADANGVIQGQAGYNVKRDLDRIAGRNSNESHYAGMLKNNLMDAYNNSVSPEVADGFKTLRQQYGNMKDLQNLAQNGAEGGISVARLAGLKDIGNPQLQDLADIAAQFVKQRESAHGAAQRVWGGGLLGGAGFMLGGLHGVAALPIGMGAGRITNSLLNSDALKNAAISGAGEMPEYLRNYGLLNLPSVINAQ